MTFIELKTWQNEHIQKEGGALFMSRLPERWLEDPTWRCTEGHVSKRFLRSDKDGSCCLACGSQVVLTFPEDAEDAQT